LGNRVRVLPGSRGKRFVTYFAGVVLLALCAFYVMIGGYAKAAPITAGPIVDAAIDAFAFNPQVITVTAGTMVRWTNNQSGIQHTSSSDVTDTLSTNYWNSPFLSTGQSFTRTFTTAGVYAYHCNVHFGMHGTVVVLSSVYLPMILQG